MSDLEKQGVGGERRGLGGVPDFEPKAPKGAGMPVSAWLTAGVVVLAVLAVLVIGSHKKVTHVMGVQPPAAYAANLTISGLQMSESESLAGGKSTFVDGRVRNTGNQTVTGVTVQVLFRNDEGLPPAVETVPLTLIRTREPYVDTQTVGAAPLKPGDEREFRLIFESIPTNWNRLLPEIRMIQVETK
ncbi:MAG TPA: DUF2393 family protein [Edaphobacter sp.]